MFCATYRFSHLTVLPQKSNKHSIFSSSEPPYTCYFPVISSDLLASSPTALTQHALLSNPHYGRIAISPAFHPVGQTANQLENKRPHDTQEECQPPWATSCSVSSQHPAIVTIRWVWVRLNTERARGFTKTTSFNLINRFSQHLDGF